MNRQKLLNTKIGDLPLLWTLFILACVIIFPFVFPSRYVIRVAGSAGIWIMLTLGLNVICGFAGLLDLGYVVFWGIGGYICALLASGHLNLHLPFLAIMPISIAGACLVGLMIGAATLRVRGDYLGIVTLAFMQVFRLLLLNLDRPVDLTGGPNGIVDVDYPRIFGFTLNNVTQMYFLIWVFTLLLILASLRLKSSRLGRAWEAIREDELASNAMGINTVWLKILAFVTGAGFAGATGALFAVWTGGVYPNNYDFGALNTIYCMLIIGGIGNVRGCVMGALVLAVLPELLRNYGDWRMIGYGLLLVVMVIVRPQGLLAGLDFKMLRRLRAARRKDREEVAQSPSVEPVAPPVPISEELLGSIQKIDVNPDRLLLDVRNVTMRFGGLLAVDNLSFQLREGEIVSIIGPNGAGKTTVFNLITGIYKPTEGSVVFNGTDITNLKPHQIVKRGIARTFQSIRLYDNMSILDNVKTAQYCRTYSNIFSILLRLPSVVRTEKKIEETAKRHLGVVGSQLLRGGDELARNLSYANRRHLEIARALCTGPRLVLLDEPSAGMNPHETAEITTFIKRLRDEYGYSFLLIEHKLEFVKSLSTRVVVLDYGKKIAEGTYGEVANNESVIEAYLGRKRA